MRYLPLLFGFIALLLSSCGTRNKTNDIGTEAASHAAQVIRSMEENAFKTQYLDGTARIKLESDKLNIAGSATIRLERDKAIWISVRKFGLEGARALIRPDSFFVYNRLEREYTAEPLSYFETKYKIPADFELLQEIILGNAVFFSRDLELAKDDDRIELRGADTRYKSAYVVDANAYQLAQMDLQELGSERELTIINSDYRALKGSPFEFAYGRVVRVNSDDSGPARVELDFSRVVLEGPLDMPFRKR